MKKLILIALLSTFSFGKEYFGCKNKNDLENLKFTLEIGGMTQVKYMANKGCIETTKKWKDQEKDGEYTKRCMTTGTCYWFLKD